MTKGKDSGQSGNALPLVSTSARTMVQDSTTIDALTISLSSGVTDTAGGQGLVVRRNYYAGTSGGTELFVAEYDGVRGYRHIETMSSASTAITLGASQSGTFFLLNFTASSGFTVTLPAVAQGLWYEFFTQTPPNSGVTTIAAPTCGTMVRFNDTAADAIYFGTDAAASGTEIGMGCRVLSDGTKWLVIPEPALTSAALTTGTMSAISWKS